ncbi:uncharacterized protein LOC131257553 [Magnolia sinica]|uniref:uncharacterized protein LOC131257553 n=1 Tax=Magnolia sinica TaxID=86752 RepID=UPI002657B8EC|nr:uncharacterized protein LOC131257553 [Magnolia sinica]
MKTTMQMLTPTISNAIIVKKCFKILRCSSSITRISTIGSMKYFIMSVKIVETSTPVRLYYNYIRVGMAMSDNTAMANAVISNRLSGPLIDRSFLTAEHGGDSDVGFSGTAMSGNTVTTNAMLSNRLSGPLIDEGDSGSGRFLSMQGNMGGRNLPRNHGRLMGITNNWTMLCIAAQSYLGPDDDQSSGFQTGEKCYICKRDVDYVPTGTMSKPSGTIPTVVLACDHVFHECLCHG